jgi:hypothetical protein
VIKSVSLLIVTLLLLESFLPAVEQSELSKLPYLFEHFTRHQREDHNMSFLEFLAMHYENQKHHDQDHQNHHKLPFSNHNHQAHVELNFIALTMEPLATFSSLIPLRDIPTVRYVESVPSGMSITIWQPPKSV